EGKLSGKTGAARSSERVARRIRSAERFVFLAARRARRRETDCGDHRGTRKRNWVRERRWVNPRRSERGRNPGCSANISWPFPAFRNRRVAGRSRSAAALLSLGIRRPEEHGRRRGPSEGENNC